MHLATFAAGTTESSSLPEQAAAIAPPTLTDIAIVGLGYVGLPLSLQFARSGVNVLGLDVDPEMVNALSRQCIAINHGPRSRRSWCELVGRRGDGTDPRAMYGGSKFGKFRALT
jgi:UDP-glucose/GDP-mannose dehydrogenase family, NAD binding domain